MSLLATALSTGFDALLRAAGVSVTIRSTPVSVLIDRNPRPRAREEGMVDYDPQRVTRIEHRTDALTSLPIAGEAYAETLDDNSVIYHLIREVFPKDFTVECDCITSETA